MIRVGVVGATGRMGREVCRAVAADPDLALVAAVSHSAPGASLADAIGLDGESGAVVLAEHLEGISVPAPRCSSTSRHPCTPRITSPGVSPTACTSWSAPPGSRSTRRAEGPWASSSLELRDRRRAADALRRAGRPSPTLAEVIELHHDGKADAPSGTALLTARRIGAARENGTTAPSGDDAFPGARGRRRRRRPGALVRLPGLVAHEEVIFGGLGQTLTLRHDSTDRTSFMPGGAARDQGSSDASGSHGGAGATAGTHVSKRLAVVVAHPDDDTYACAATVARHAEDPAFRFVLCTRRAGSGRISDPTLATRATLGEVARRTLALVGPPRTGRPIATSGSPYQFPLARAVRGARRCVEDVLADERPDVVLTFGLEHHGTPRSHHLRRSDDGRVPSAPSARRRRVACLAWARRSARSTRWNAWRVEVGGGVRPDAHTTLAGPTRRSASRPSSTSPSLARRVAARASDEAGTSIRCPRTAYRVDTARARRDRVPTVAPGRPRDHRRLRRLD